MSCLRGSSTPPRVVRVLVSIGSRRPPRVLGLSFWPPQSAAVTVAARGFWTTYDRTSVVIALYSPPRTDLTGKITSRLIMPLNSDPSRLGRWLHRCLLTDSLTLKASTVPCTTVSGAWNWKTGLRDNSKWINCTARGDVFLPEQPRDTRASRAWQDCDHAPADLQPAPGNSQGHSLGAWLCSSSNWVPVISPGVLPSLSLPADLCLHGVFGVHSSS